MNSHHYKSTKSMNHHKRKTITFVVIFLVCVSVTGNVEVRCMEKEREALLSFKSGLIDESNILSSWRQTDDCCKWYGVWCSNTTGHVVYLVLDGYYGKLRGKIGSSLLDLHHLTALGLPRNDFGGDRIPEFIGSMKQLQGLSLSFSNFSGAFPPQIGNLTNLIHLDLSYNTLGCKNLDWLSSLSLLRYLDLSYSFDLSHANWPQHILSLPYLQTLILEYCNIISYDVKPSADILVNSSSSPLSYLVLSHNHLTSSIFNWLSNINTSVIQVDLSYNALGGLIPDAFERLTLLQHLDLSSNMLEGGIPKSLGNLSDLRYLVLFNNSLSGRIDDEFLRNISTKGISESLEVLDLASNQLNGSVPDLRPFSALTEVYLGRNKLTGSIPLSIGQISKLRVIEVSRNKLEGTVSESHFIKLDSLQVLDVSFNQLKLNISPDWNPPFRLSKIFLAGCEMGSVVPKWIQTQRNVTEIDLSGAGIVGEVPKWLWTYSPSLEVLSLSHNQITGILPDLSTSLILHLDVSSNNLSGPIPLFHSYFQTFQVSQNMLTGSISSICEMTRDSLVFLDLSYNQFSGEIPDCWQKMPGLFFLSLGSNRFSGVIPTSLGVLQYLNILQLHDNNLSGELPSSLVLCKKLQVIDVGRNDLTGNIPSWIGYTALVYMNFRKNRFYGSICQEICNLKQTRVMDFSRNNLSGKIPDCFNNFTDLAEKRSPDIFSGYRYGDLYNPRLPNRRLVINYHEYSIVNWKAQESVSMQDLPFLKLIDFSSNSLTGEIPGSLSSMRALKSLNLSRNSLTGNIIIDIGQMESLECLDLSNNQLSGQIPISLAELSFLAILDLSNNNLSGRIPGSSQLQSFDISSYAGNNGLCGFPLEMCPENVERPTHEDGGLSFMQEVGISMGFGCIVGFWGVVGSLALKRSWRYAYFNFLDAVGDWLYVTTTILLSKCRRS